MRSLRVLVVTVWYPTPDAPIAYTFVRAGVRAAATRHDVAVLHLRDVPELSRARGPSLRLDEEGFPVWEVEVPAANLPGVTFMGRVLAAVRAVRTITQRFGSADIVHAHMLESAAPALAVSRVAARGSRAGRVLTEHYSGFALGDVTVGQVLKARGMFPRFDAILPVSRALAHSLGDVGVQGRKVVVPNAYDPDVFHPPGDDTRTDESAVRLFAVGRLERVKGFDILLRALAQTASQPGTPDWRLRIAGTGGQRHGLEALAHTLGLEGKVKFGGALPQAVVAEEMRNSDLFVAPSLYETQGAAIIEAAGSGLRILASNVGGIPEVVRLVEGRLVPPGDVEAWAAALSEEMDHGRRFDLPARQRQARRARESWSLSAVGAKLDAVYRSILQT